MTSEQRAEVAERLHEALAQSPETRTDFLIRHCSSETVRLEVERLLAKHQSATHFPERPMADAITQLADLDLTAPVTWSMTGRIVSHYRVDRELARGGMGVVYQAEDINLQRRVAIKLLPGEVTANPASFERLQREARAASSLDHPNICSIYELGDYQGSPFIAMQLLEGQTLRQWIETAGQLSASSRLSQALDLAIQTANGLAAAHQKGVIHRDIKPPNIFVTNRGEAKILDFGLAKILEGQPGAGLSDATLELDAPDSLTKSHLTRTGMRMGTAHYMSPEQVRGEDLDARTDLFSLGLVIYEMATGHRGFTGETWASVHESILHREPPSIRQLNPSLPPELDRIVNKAIKKDRADRYSSAGDLARDLASLRDRLGPETGWLARKRLVLAAVPLVLFIGLSFGFLLRRVFHTPSTASPLNAKHLRSVAVLGFRNLAGKPEGDWVSTALAEMISTELAAGQQLRIIPGESVAHMKLDLALPSTVGYGPDTLKKIRNNLGTDAIIQGSYLLSAGAHLRIDLKVQDADRGDTIAAVSETGSDTQIADLVSQAGVSLRQQLGVSPLAAGSLDKVRAILPSNPQAARFYSEGLAMLRLFDASAARDLFLKAIALEPNHALSYSSLAESLSALGYDARAQAEAKTAFELSHSLPRETQLLVEGRYREISNNYPAALDVYRTLWKFFPDNVDYGLKVAASQIKASLAKDALLTIAQLRKLPEASSADLRIDLIDAAASESLADFRRTQQITSAVAEKARVRGSRLLEARAKHDEGWAWDRLGEFDKALSSFSEAGSLAQAGGNLREAARNLNSVGSVLYDKGDLEGALKVYEESIEVARQAGAQADISAAYHNIGNVLYDQGKLEAARQHYEQGIATDRLLNDKRSIASDLGSLANVLQGIGDLVGATAMQEQTLQAFRDVGDRRGEGATLDNLGSVLTDRGDLASAKLHFEQALSIFQQIGYRRGRGFVLSSLSRVLEAQDRLPEARAATQEALALRQELKDGTGIAESTMQLAEIEWEEGNASQAERLARSVAQEFEKEKATDDGCVAGSILVHTLLSQGKFKDAQIAADSSGPLCRQSQDRSVQLRSQLARAALNFKAGNPAEALAMLRKIDADAQKSGFVAYELEAQLLMAQIEISWHQVLVARSRFASIQEKANRCGFSLIARRARTLAQPTLQN
jgi:serine/threonine protein kinase/tetratricopeptide (TPR) repeat protein